MKVVALLLALAMCARADLFFEDTVKSINRNPKSTWTAAIPSRFNNTDDVKMLCGTWQKGHPNYERLPELPASASMAIYDEDVPDTFDARTQWGDKCSVIKKVRDQSSCGSCWAFGSTEAFENRRCIATGKDVEFSAEDTAACCSGFACGLSMGCNGGQPSSALSWMASTGIVTGGDFFDIGKNTGCLPYSMKPCAHHVPPTAKYGKCPSSEYPTPQCSKQCSESGYGTDYSSDKTKGEKAYSVSGEANIQKELMTKGPLAVAFTVYADFPTYKSGVYQHTSGQQLGGHAVLMVGWGTENGTPYWLIKNSWNEEWGDGGFFKIKRGSDECGITNDVTGISF